jgi:hypothetical protein
VPARVALAGLAIAAHLGRDQVPVHRTVLLNGRDEKGVRVQRVEHGNDSSSLTIEIVDDRDR